jgi:hypothetical protein
MSSALSGVVLERLKKNIAIPKKGKEMWESIFSLNSGQDLIQSD